MKINEQQDVVVFTDGASRGNPGPGGYGAVLIYPKLEEVIELGGAKPTTTNNEMELSAVIAALSYLIQNVAPTHIFSDSKYVLQGAQTWMYGWQKNGWQTQAKEPVKNKELWQTMLSLVTERKSQTKIHWHHLPGHSGVPGNERADVIATEFADGKRFDLFRGSQRNYPIKDILDTTVDPTKIKSSSSKASAGKAYEYLSVVGGVLERHQTWDACKARTTGQKSHFRKSVSPEQSKEIIMTWRQQGVIYN
jgi:ribonuclease HI